MNWWTVLRRSPEVLHGSRWFSGSPRLGLSETPEELRWAAGSTRLPGEDQTIQSSQVGTCDLLLMIFKAGRKAQGLRWCCFIAVDKMFNNVQHLSTLLFYILSFKYSKHGVLCVCVLGEIVSPVSTSPYHLQNENLSHDVWIHVFHSFSHSLIPEYLFPPNRETQATASRHHSQHFQAN